MYVHDATGRLAAEYSAEGIANPGVRYLTADHLGSTRVVTEASGQALECRDYHAFGEEILVEAGSPRQGVPCYTADAGVRQKFTGKERDAGTGLDFFGARYYSAVQGRFTSADPRYFQATALVDPQRFNLYSYARNNPLKWVDPEGERLYLSGDTSWLLTNVLYGMSGGQEQFDKYFHIENGQVVLNDGADTSNLDAGLQLILDQVNSTDNYLYYAGTSGDSAAMLFQGTTGKNGKLNQTGKNIANLFTCGGGFVTGCGTLVGTLGRPNAREPANLANGDPVFALIAYNEDAVMTQIGVGAAGDLAKSGVGQPIAPASLFVHEAAENLAFRSQGNWNYPQAHDAAIRREGQIRQDLHSAGGWAGGEIRTTVPKK